MIRVVIAYPIAYMLYWTGHLISCALFHSDRVARWFGWMYPVYNKLMCLSADVQDWGGGEHGPWKRCETPTGNPKSD